jgi:hypothetical protein
MDPRSEILRAVMKICRCGSRPLDHPRVWVSLEQGCELQKSKLFDVRKRVTRPHQRYWQILEMKRLVGPMWKKG